LGRLAETGAWANANQDLVSPQLPRFSAYDYDRFALAEVLIAQGQWERADALVADLLGDAEATDHGRLVIWALVLRALIARGQGDIPAALAAIERALALAEPEGYVRVFADAGPSMADLLRSAATRGIAPRYVERLLNAIPNFELKVLSSELAPEYSLTQNSKLKTQNSLMEPLSPRELQVLRLLAVGHDNAAIAQQLVVAVSTVKSHVNHLLAKLGARNRLEAVLRAQDLNLL
jgi:LuxR family maltose regulon positive regulatory protein